MKLGFLIALWGLAGATKTTFADDSPCFDFSQPVTEPLATPVSLNPTEVSYATGTLDGEGYWGAARGLVSVPPRTIFDWLLDHKNWKDPGRTSIEVKDLPSPHGFAYHRVEVRAHIFAFIYIGWVEEWFFSILKGADKKLPSYLVSYQKVEDNRYIRKLCGSVWIQPSGTTRSDVSFYERARADHYKDNDIRGLHESLFQKLQTLAAEIAESKAPSK